MSSLSQSCSHSWLSSWSSTSGCQLLKCEVSRFSKMGPTSHKADNEFRLLKSSRDAFLKTAMEEHDGR